MSDERDIELSSEILDVAMTQDPLVFFIPYVLAVILSVSMFALGTLFHTWKVILIMPVLWAIAAVWTKRDRNAINVFLAKLNLIQIWMVAYRHGGLSLNLPDRRSMPKQEMIDAT